MKAILVLEDGTTFHGKSFGAEGEAAGQVIFNTQVVGYQEIITDPANRENIIAMGYPHIGNYGINDRLNESDSAHASALVVKEYSKIYSNWQAKESLGDFMKRNKVIGIEDVDTRSLTVHIRENGEMKGIVSTKDFNKESLIRKASAFKSTRDKIQAKCKSKISNSKTIIINIGANISTLAKYPEASLVSAETLAEEILESKPKLVVISSGPGDPRELTGLVDEIKKLIGKVSIYGIQNGACVVALALGCSIYKMKAGHHGMNHPVVDPKTGRGEISVQNHSYGIESAPSNVKVVHVNLNDKTIEKIESKDGSCVGTLYFPIDERGKLDPGYRRV